MRKERSVTSVNGRSRTLLWLPATSPDRVVCPPLAQRAENTAGSLGNHGHEAPVEAAPEEHPGVGPGPNRRQLGEDCPGDGKEGREDHQPRPNPSKLEDELPEECSRR